MMTKPNKLKKSNMDACHIIPFSESFNDAIANGLSLCPNLHSALDRGLISINNDFRVIVNKNFSEPFSSAYNIKQFEGKQILLPSNDRHFPSFESLGCHRGKFGLGMANISKFNALTRKPGISNLHIQ